MRICVFCSSSDAVAGLYRAAAADFGRALARAGHGLVYGGSNVGLMNALARAALEEGAEVVGVMPEFMRRRNLAIDGAARMVFTPDMRGRKAEMERLADAFVALPGGFGTLEEILEVLTLRALGRHEKPVVFLSVDGFYEPLLAFFDRLYEQRFAAAVTRSLYHVAATGEDALAYLASFTPAPAPDKWRSTRASSGAGSGAPGAPDAVSD
jgi:uncharacterized protein (TIGR00730 family)